MLAERRRKRSNFAGLALHYWLTSLARRKGVTGLVLADSAGLLVASSLPSPEAEELAAVAPLLADPSSLSGTLLDDWEVPVLVQTMTVDRSRLHLVAVGSGRQSRDCLQAAVGGIQRILTTH